MKNYLKEVPKGEKNDRSKLNLYGSKRVLILNDLHIPYHDEKSINLALNYAASKKVDTIILNGDVVDFYSISSFSRKPDKIFLQDEIKVTDKFLSTLRKGFKNQKIYFKIGNHENRLEKFINNVPELFNLENIKIDSLFDFKNKRINLVEDKKIMTVGKMNIIHGHEIRCSSSLYLAKNMLKKFDDNVCFGHFHRSDEFVEVDLYNNRLESFAIGSLCDNSPDYCAFNNWNTGFGLINIKDNKGNYDFENKRIIKGRIY